VEGYSKGQHRADEGMALVLTLLCVMLLSGAGLSLLLVTDTDRRMSGSQRVDQETRLAAEAGLERAIAELALAPDWGVILAGGAHSSFAQGTRRPIIATGRSIDLDALTIEVQAAGFGGSSFGANTPVWRLYGWGAMPALAPAAAVDSRQYLAMWVADDPSETDGMPSSDSNGELTVRADAFGPLGHRRAVEATIRRAASGVRVLAMREAW
jgi:hypothetical protein